MDPSLVLIGVGGGEPPGGRRFRIGHCQDLARGHAHSCHGHAPGRDDRLGVGAFFSCGLLENLLNLVLDSRARLVERFLAVQFL